MCCLQENIREGASSVSQIIKVSKSGLELQIGESSAWRCFLKQEAEQDHLGESK